MTLHDAMPSIRRRASPPGYVALAIPGWRRALAELAVAG